MRKARQRMRFPDAGANAGTAGKPFARTAPALLIVLCATDGARSAATVCSAGPQAAAASNAASIGSLLWSPFGRAEVGWTIYEPLIAEEIGSLCAPASPGFAATLTLWQKAHGLSGTGVLDATTFQG